ncbi:MAG: type III-A CRISPR-associated RAMP protein Csm3 [Candidatus Helarchaeota archaeon]
MEYQFIGKIILSGIMTVDTGLHVGASKDTMDVGGIDTPVIRDPITNRPFIPGSSLKGKLRSLFERALFGQIKFNRHLKNGKINRHECDTLKEAKNCKICRMFGSTGDTNCPSRLIIRDMQLTNDSFRQLKKIETGLYLTEWKFENSIDRITSAANPRQIERIPAGSKFEFEIIYNIEDEKSFKEDMNHLRQLFDLLSNDYLGGHGSRGYGKVSFEFKKTIKRSIEFYFGNKEEEQFEFK